MNEMTGQKNNPQLETLAASQKREEALEAQKNLIDMPRPLSIETPSGGRLPKSEAWRARLYHGDRMAQEKKPGLFDHLRSVGPWMVSIDDEPMSVLDGMSQTATLTNGFSPDKVVDAYMAGRFGDTPLVARDTSGYDSKVVDQYARQLSARVPGLDHVAFTNSGAEANEKAFALCRSASRYPHAKKVLAFKGSFHGRTLLALQSTWNPVKRAPFELPSYTSVFVDFPLKTDTNTEFTHVPEGFVERLISLQDMKDLDAFRGQSDALFDAELESLKQVVHEAQTGLVFALIIEPMQSEGGDRYASARFYRHLRIITRHLGLPMIIDEVQTGFGLGGPFDWCSRFRFVTAEGQPDFPDAITYAKRAQVGVCISRYPDPEPTSAHTTSIQRGTIQEAEMDYGATAQQVEHWVTPKLRALSEKYPELVQRPRQTGFAFAFDLPSPKHLSAYLGQRFWRGAVVFGAGTETVRYRLSHAFERQHITSLFETIEASLSYLSEHGPDASTKWQDRFTKPATKPVEDASHEIRIRLIEPRELDLVISRIMEIESLTYEPARRDPQKVLELAFDKALGVAVVAELKTEETWTVIGSALAASARHFMHIDGPKQDPLSPTDTLAYSIALTVLKKYRGLGLGRKLKAAQLTALRGKLKSDGTPQFRYLVGRNRVGATQSMMHLNQSFGAYKCNVYKHQYGEEDGAALYYRLPLHGFIPEPHSGSDPRLFWSDGISAPLAEAPAGLNLLHERGQLFGPTVNKITVCNYVTPAIVKSIEWHSALAPEFPHLYLTSGRDELIDKSVRLLRYQRKDAEVCLSFHGSYFGHTSATSRSLSCPGVQRQGAPIFDWGRSIHPEDSPEGFLAELDDLVRQYGGAEKILGLFVEPLGERSGKTLSPGAAAILNRWSESRCIPLISMETAGFCRGFERPFGYQALGLNAALMGLWAGGQTGYLHVKTPWFISKPLMMVSTWDGDELSMIRTRHNSQALLSRSDRIDNPDFESVYAVFESRGYRVSGQHHYRTVDMGARADEFVAKCASEGLVLRAYPNGIVPLSLPYGLPSNELKAGISIIERHLVAQKA